VDPAETPVAAEAGEEVGSKEGQDPVPDEDN